MSLLIKNVVVLDGTGKPPQEQDVLVRGAKIVALGRFPRHAARDILDGRGGYLAPGFIDPSVSLDRFGNLFSNDQTQLLKQGITTVMAGQCGISLAPIFHDSFKAVREQMHSRSYNINWQTFADFFAAMRKRRFGVNFGSFVGHQTLRHVLTHDDFRKLTPRELSVLGNLAERSASEGVIGFSLGAGYSLAHPVDDAELKLLFQTASQKKIPIAIHLPELSKGINGFILNLLDYASKTSSPLILNHLVPREKSDDLYNEIISLIEENRDRASLYFSITPPQKAQALPALSLLPLWTREDPEQVAQREKDAVVRQLKTPAFRKKILDELPRFRNSNLSILHAPQYPELSSVTLREFSAREKMTQAEGILSLLERTNGNVLLLATEKRHRDSALLSHERVLLTSNATGFNGEDSEFFPFLLKTVSSSFGLPEAIHHVTGLPAALFGIHQRGFIRPHFYADLVLFRNNSISEVFVNGVPVIRDGEGSGTLAGKTLRRNL